MINKASYYYEHRWHADMDYLIESEDFLKEWIRGRSSPRISKPFKRIGGYFIIQIIPSCYFILWFLLFCFSIYLIISPSFGETIVKTILGAK
jgi:hypothetical protein